MTAWGNTAIRLIQPASECLGLMKEEYLAGTRFGIEAVREPGFDAC
jgi:hypothetical protein